MQYWEQYWKGNRIRVLEVLKLIDDALQMSTGTESSIKHVWADEDWTSSETDAIGHQCHHPPSRPCLGH